MGSHHDHEATYLFRYDREADRFTARRDQGSEPRMQHIPNEAILFLDNDPDEFIIFNNNSPGQIDFVSHSADNLTMKKILGLAVLNKMYGVITQNIRNMTERQDKAGYQWKGTFLSSTEKHVACLGLHVLALGATDEVAELGRAIHEAISPEAATENEEA